MTRAIVIALGLFGAIAAQDRKTLQVRVVDSVRESGIADASVELTLGPANDRSNAPHRSTVGPRAAANRAAAAIDRNALLRIIPT